MEPRTFEDFRDLIYRLTGISLKPGKESLLSSRVNKRMRVLGLTEYRDYLNVVLNDAAGLEVIQLIDAIATNVTSFFREPRHFEFVDQQVRAWIAEGRTRLRFWSAASSTGEEPYSLAITLAEAAASHPDADIRILATDISTRVLDYCRHGVYSPQKLETLAPRLRDRWFRKPASGAAGWQADESLRRMIAVARLNLSSPPFPMKGPFDIIFCRNVMIYFDDPVRRALLAEVHRLLRPGGFLIVGHAESLTGTLGSFKSVRPSVYARI